MTSMDLHPLRTLLTLRAFKTNVYAKIKSAPTKGG
jgi:hypothetical protein